MKPLRIAQISDLHCTHTSWNPRHLLSKRIVGNLNWMFARKHEFSGEPLKTLPALLTSLQVDLVLLAGDFTTTSLEREFEIADAFVQKLPAPWIAVPGNHDRYTRRACRERRFYRYFSNKRDAACEEYCLAEHRVEAHVIAPEWWVIALDTAHATNLYSSTGLFFPEQEAVLREVLALIPADHKILLLNHYPFFDNGSQRHALKRGDALEALVQQEPRIKAYLHGHTHRHTIADLQPSLLPIILDGGSVASAHNGSWNLLTLDDHALNVDVYKWNQEWTHVRQETLPWAR